MSPAEPAARRTAHWTDLLRAEETHEPSRAPWHRRHDTSGRGAVAGAGPRRDPKRGGTIVLRPWDPPHFDPYLQVSYKTHIVYSFTHNRLVKYKSGPGVVPGTFAIEGDLAES